MKRFLAILATTLLGASTVPASPVGGEDVPKPTALVAPALECTCSYGGETRTITVEPTTDPYALPAVALGNRFLFRAVWVTDPSAEAALNLYVFRATKDGPVLLHQARFRPPFPTALADSPYGFTGLHFVYEPDLGRELQFWRRGQP